MQADSDGRSRIEKFLAARGVTSYFPTTVTAPLDVILQSLERIADGIELAAKKPEPGRAQSLGIHLEGPFLSHARRGVHPPENLLEPTVGAFDRFWQAGRGHIRLMTIAPELPGAPELITEATKRGVCISIGHSDADLSAARAGVAAGARHATHTFNAMRPLDHREPGIIGEVLSNSAMTAEIIADGIHVHPDVVRLFLQAKGPERAVLITDGTAAAGMPDGKYWLGSMEVDVKNGKCLHEGTLAGSVLTLDRAVRNVMAFGGWNLQQSIRAATFNPARVTRAAKKGRVEPGADADFAVLAADGQVRATITRGVVAQP
jgi:N-acetylglucosamine-6-phosphate deacetylase